MRRRGFLGLFLTPLLPTKADPVDILTSADRELAKILPQLEAYYYRQLMDISEQILANYYSNRRMTTLQRIEEATRPRYET